MIHVTNFIYMCVSKQKAIFFSFFPYQLKGKSVVYFLNLLKYYESGLYLALWFLLLLFGKKMQQNKKSTKQVLTRKPDLCSCFISSVLFDLFFTTKANHERAYLAATRAFCKQATSQMTLVPFSYRTQLILKPSQCPLEQMHHVSQEAIILSRSFLKIVFQ